MQSLYWRFSCSKPGVPRLAANFHHKSPNLTQSAQDRQGIYFSQFALSCSGYSVCILFEQLPLVTFSNWSCCIVLFMPFPNHMVFVCSLFPLQGCGTTYLLLPSTWFVEYHRLNVNRFVSSHQCQALNDKFLGRKSVSLIFSWIC